MNKENLLLLFKCSWSRGVVAITVLCSVLNIAVLFFVIVLDEWPSDMLWIKYLTVTFLSVFIIYGIAMMPLNLKVCPEKIVLKRLFDTKSIPVDKIEEIRIISKSEILKSIRICGSGGWFGYWGWFKNRSLGFYTMSATDLDKLILVCTDRKKYVLSCSHHIDFVEKVKSFTQY